MIARRGFVFWLTWVNFGWQVVFSLSWNLGLKSVAEAAWGERAATLVFGAGCLGPTLVVAVVVFRWAHKIGLWP